MRETFFLSRATRCCFVIQTAGEHKNWKKSRQKKIMNGTFGEHSLARLCSKIVPGNRQKIARVETWAAWAMENKLFVMTFKCLRFISLDGSMLLLAVNMGILTGDEFSSSIILWFKFEADNLCCRRKPNRAWNRVLFASSVGPRQVPEETLWLLWLAIRYAHVEFQVFIKREHVWYGRRRWW